MLSVQKQMASILTQHTAAQNASFKDITMSFNEEIDRTASAVTDFSSALDLEIEESIDAANAFGFATEQVNILDF